MSEETKTATEDATPPLENNRAKTVSVDTQFLSESGIEKQIEEKIADNPSPNVKFIGKRLYLDKKTGEQRLKLTRPEDIPTQRINGQHVFDLPSGEEQLKGFYHEEAAKLVQFYGNKFKPIVNKGEKS